jgi:UDP-glucose 4-epimerase
MNFIVTGGCGFIGSHIVEKLSLNKRNKIYIIDNLSNGRLKNIKKFLNSKVKFIKFDISKDFKSLNSKISIKIDAVIHFAALADIVPSITNPEKYFESNIVGTKNVIEYVKNKKIKKLVYAASSSCYGIPKKYPTSENENIDAKYPYALTKKIGEDLIMHWSKVYNFEAISLRLFNVYGPRARTSGTYGAVFGVFLSQKINNKPLTIVGDGSQSRDFTYVTDVVDAVIKSIKLRGSHIINIGTGKSITINYIAKKLSNKFTYIPKRPGEPDVTLANISKAKKILKWKPRIKINEGLKFMLKNIDYWKEAPIWDKKKIKIATKDWFKFLK